MLRTLVCCLAVLCFGGVASAQVTMNIASLSGEPGATVSVPVTLTLDTAAQGFQLGVSHDGAIASATLIEQGPSLMTSNGGAGADYFFTDLAPAGGTGVTLGSILSLAPPLEDLTVGSHQIASITYTIAPTALPGTNTPLQITSALGTPALSTVVSINSTSIVPAMEHGEIAVTTPGITGLQSATLDVCTCAAELSWTNGFAYDSIEVYADGLLLTTLPGTATSHALTLGTEANYCVRGIANGLAAADACVLASCAVPATGLEPTAISCTIDHATCAVDVLWTNQETDYTAIDILLDGALVETLPGTASSTIVTLPATEVLSTIEVVARDFCGTTLPAVSCQTECLPEQFIRGDANGDGGIDISDAIGALGYIFSGATVGCLDALDSNDSGSIDISDAINVLGYIFSAGAPPQAPFGACGVDPTDADLLDCAAYTCP